MAINSAGQRPPGFLNVIREAVDARIQEEVNKVFDEHRDMLIQQVEKKRAEILASVAVRVSELVSYQDLGRELRITLVKPDAQG